MPEKIKENKKPPQPPRHRPLGRDTLTVLAQVPVPHANKIKKRVLFVDHQLDRVPQLEAIGITKGIAKKNKQPHNILM